MGEQFCGVRKMGEFFQIYQMAPVIDGETGEQRFANKAELQADMVQNGWAWDAIITTSQLPEPLALNMFEASIMVKSDGSHTIDLVKAREVQMRRIRAVRDASFSAIDSWRSQIADMPEGEAKTNALNDQRELAQALRDLPKNPSIIAELDSCTDLASIAAYYPAILRATQLEGSERPNDTRIDLNTNTGA